VKTRRGSGFLGGQPPLLKQRILARSKALRAGRRDVALSGNRWQRDDANDERARDADEGSPALREGKPLKVNPVRGSGVK